MPRWGRYVTAVLAGVAIFVSLALTRSWWLHGLGDYLVETSPAVHADAALVLAGEIRGYRLMRAADLVRDGYVPKVLVSGPMSWYGVNEADLAIQFAIRKGYPREWFEPVYIRALSTLEEARALIPEIEKRGVRKLLIVTSDYHTRRAGRIYRMNSPSSLEFRFIAAPDPYFSPNGWWHTREGQKIWFFETSKTVAGWAGL